MDYEGTAINKGTLRFLANNTEVEWMMAENISGSYGRLTTSNSKTGVGYDYEHIWEGYDAMYHSHPRRYGPDRAYLGPSDADREATGFFAKAGYSKCSIYEATTDEWVTYYGKKDSDEVYENEMTRPI